MARCAWLTASSSRLMTLLCSVSVRCVEFESRVLGPRLRAHDTDIKAAVGSMRLRCLHVW